MTERNLESVTKIYQELSKAITSHDINAVKKAGKDAYLALGGKNADDLDYALKFVNATINKFAADYEKGHKLLEKDPINAYKLMAKAFEGLTQSLIIPKLELVSYDAKDLKDNQKAALLFSKLQKKLTEGLEDIVDEDEE